MGPRENDRLSKDWAARNKTLQQITEEFAETLPPKAWLREDRNISRLAERLSVSSKKVRRILRNVEFLRQG